MHPYTYRVLAEKFDPVDIQDAVASISLMTDYINEILKDSGYSAEECQTLPSMLTTAFKTHGDVINLDRALECEFHCVPASQYLEEWQLFREWLEKYMLQEHRETHNSVCDFRKHKRKLLKVKKHPILIVRRRNVPHRSFRKSVKAKHQDLHRILGTD